MQVDPGKNYFELFDLPVAFDIDTDELAVRYRELQRCIHPDKFAGGTDQERRLSLQMAALINEAFQTLRSPVKRGRYFLGLRGVDMNDEIDTAMDPAFLMEQMELRENLAEVKQAKNPQQQLAAMAKQIDGRIETKIGQFRRNLAEPGAAGAQKARAAVREMQFLEKLRREIDSLEEELI